MKVTILASKANYRDVETESQWEFVHYVLENLGIPEDELAESFPHVPNNPDDKIKLRQLLSKFSVSVIDDHDGGIKIYVNQSNDDGQNYILVAEWKKCKFVYKYNNLEIDPNLKIYIEIHTDIWTIFDEEK